MRLSAIVILCASLATLSGCAVAVPVYQSQKTAAADAATKSDLLNSKVALVSILVTDMGVQSITAADLESNGGGTTEATPDLAVHFTPPEEFCIDGLSKSGAQFKITDSVGPVTGTCVEGTDF